MKIAYVLPYLEKPSGWRTHSLALLGAMRKYVEMVLFVSQGEYEIAKSLFPEHSIFRLPVTQQANLGSIKGWRNLAACFQTIRLEDYPPVQLVHSLEAYPTGLVGSWLARKLNCPHAITSHGTYGVMWYDRLMDRLAYQRVLKGVSLVCPVSFGTAQIMRQYFGKELSTATLRPILNGNNFVQAIPRSSVLERKLPSIPTLLSVGDVKPRKGYHLSLQAFNRLKSRYPQARYWIVGHKAENDYSRCLLNLISEKNLAGVEFLGCVSDEELHHCYQEASVFVLTSQPGEGSERLHFEGFGLVYLEAGAYGVPVVGVRTGGVPDAVQDGVTGILVQPGDVEGVEQALDRLLGDVDLNLKMGRANRDWAEMLTWERCAGEHYQVYQEILNI